ncbi:MAG: amidase [Frankia sp.]
MTTWIYRLDEPGAGPRLAVKDLIAVAGLPTSAGCPAYAERHPEPAAADAAVVAAMRAAGARIAGTTTLHELGLGRTGINAWYGTARNPLDPRLIPGGSSSGSAAAVASGDADLGVGTDTGGSIRIPAACCGIAGLKTTHGRVSRHGVVAAAPSLDTVGFLARDVAGLWTAMRLAEPDFPDEAATRSRHPRASAGPVVGRLRGHAAPALEAAVDRALAATGWPVDDLVLPGFAAAERANYAVNTAEAVERHGWMLEHPDRVGADVAQRLRDGRAVNLAAAFATATAWRDELAAAFRAVDLLALPTLTAPPPRLDALDAPFGALTRPMNLAGGPALVIPLPGGPGYSLQLVGPADSEDRLLAAGLAVERARPAG